MADLLTLKISDEAKLGKEEILLDPRKDYPSCHSMRHALILNDMWYKLPDGTFIPFSFSDSTLQMRDIVEVIQTVNMDMIKSIVVPTIHDIHAGVAVDDAYLMNKYTEYKLSVDAEYDATYGEDREGDLTENPLLVTVTYGD